MTGHRSVVLGLPSTFKETASELIRIIARKREMGTELDRLQMSA
jgi:hypothetical protein